MSSSAKRVAAFVCFFTTCGVLWAQGTPFRSARQNANFNLPVADARTGRDESARIDRLVGLAKLWAAVKYFHPYLAYRDDIDWDAALITAIPKVDAARTPVEYGAAIEVMLQALGDPVTHVLSAPPRRTTVNAASPAERQPTFHRDADGVLVVAMRNYADLEDIYGTQDKLQALKKEIPSARAIVFDLRPLVLPTESQQGAAALSFSDLPSSLSTASLGLPGERRRAYQGYAPQDGSTSGGYSSGFYFQGRPSIEAAPGAKDIPVVFVNCAN
jgi:hypothetical protein